MNDLEAGSNPASTPASVGQALAAMDAALDYLNGPGTAELEVPSLGSVLETLGGLSGKFAAARASIMARFDATRAHVDDGYGSTAAWLAAKGRMTRRAANAQVRQMRQLRDHPELHEALAERRISESWTEQIAEWTRKLPEQWRAEVEKLLLGHAANGAEFEDLALLAQAAFERWRQSEGADPDDPDEDFDERSVRLGTTLDGVGRLTGDLTKECAESLQAVLESLGKKAGPEDDRTEQQRFHDALQVACQMLIRANMLPDRAGTDTRVDVIIALRELLDLPGASELQEAWLAAMAGEHAYLAGKDAEVAACDALVYPVVTGHPDLSVVDQMIEVVMSFLDAAGPLSPGNSPEPALAHSPGEAPGEALVARARSKALSPEAWRALRYAIARLAIDLVSGPGGVAATLRRGLLDEPYTTKSVVLDIGYADTIPPAIRKAVRLRAKGVCEWPGCRRRAAWCDVHHLVHRTQGGETSTRNCVLLCQFHHDVCIHRNGWRLILHPDASTTAYGPRGQVLHSHRPHDEGSPRDEGPPGSKGPPGGMGCQVPLTPER